LAARISERSHNDNDSALEIHFQNITKREAWNLISTLRLKVGLAEIDAFARQPTTASGSPTPPTTVGPNDLPSEPQWRAAAFKNLETRYDWTKATVEELPMSTGGAPSDDFSPAGYSFKITLPPGSGPEAPWQFKLSTYFRKVIKRPGRTEVRDFIEKELHDDALRIATVRTAARRVIDRINDTYSGARTAIETLDLLIVKIESKKSC
jgi:hypothetical protein